MPENSVRGATEAALLSKLIKNACVNDGRPESAQEVRNAAAIEEFLTGVPGLSCRIVEKVPGRANLIGRWTGTEPGPTLALLAHTDVVPADPAGWSFDPFSGEIRDGVVHGRGAVDMLNLAACMAAAVKNLGAEGFRPKGTVLVLAVADEEAGGKYGTGYLTSEMADEVRADYVLTEWGGVRYHTGEKPQFAMITAEKGVVWVRARITGRSAHGSRPYGADNPVVAAARLVDHLAGAGALATITPEWQRLITRLNLDEDVRAALLDPDRVDSVLGRLDAPFDAFAHACTRMTCSPTVISAGTKTNVIPAALTMELDVRTLPGQTTGEVLKLLDESAAQLGITAEFEAFNESQANSSPIDTPLWRSMEKAVAELVPGGTCVPAVTTGGNDARFYRAMGAVAYGGGLLSDRFPFPAFIGAFHGPDERIDFESLALSTDFFTKVLIDLLS